MDGKCDLRVERERGRESSKKIFVVYIFDWNIFEGKEWGFLTREKAWRENDQAAVTHASFNTDARNFLSFFSPFPFSLREESGIRSADSNLGLKYSKNLKDSGEISFPRRDDNNARREIQWSWLWLVARGCLSYSRERNACFVNAKANEKGRCASRAALHAYKQLRLFPFPADLSDFSDNSIQKKNLDLKYLWTLSFYSNSIRFTK